MVSLAVNLFNLLDGFGLKSRNRKKKSVILKTQNRHCGSK